jgi:hypothetical protein
MTIKQLKEKIKNLPDDMLVVLPGSDHSYSIGFYTGKETAMHNAHGYYEDDPSLSKKEVMEIHKCTRVKVFSFRY